MKRLIALAFAALALQAQAQLSCNPSAPRPDPGTGFTPFAALERLEVRSGRLGAADWEWGLGENTQQAGQFATANLDWVNERVYDWTLSYSGTGSATIEVRDGGAVLFTRTWATGMDAGNALKLYVKSSAGIAAGNLVTATSATINGQSAAASIQTAGTGALSESSLYWFYPAMSQGFTASGTVKLTFTGSYPPTGSRLNFIVTAGTLPCTPAPAQAKLYFIHTDHLNTPRLIADDQQRTVWRWDNTDPFGGNPPDENPSGLGTFEFPLRFPGQYADKETNLHYNYFRDYDASLGRYRESDPIGLRSGINTYAYVFSNPLSFVDPTGLQVAVLGGAIGGGLPGAGGPMAPGGGIRPSRPGDDPLGGVQAPGKPTWPFPSSGAEADGGTGQSAGRLAPPGKCTQTQHRRLQDEVDAACKIPRRCDPSQDCPQLLDNYYKNIRCAQARDEINNTCFAGGDAGHRQAANDARNAANRCIATMQQKGCANCPVPANK